MTNTSLIANPILNMFVPLDEPVESWSISNQFAGCYYVATAAEYTADGDLVLGKSGMYTWYLHEDGKLHMAAYEDDEDGNITSNGYFPSLKAAWNARAEYYSEWSKIISQTPTLVKSQPLFED